MIWMRTFYNDHHERKQRTLIFDLTTCRPVVHCQLHGTNWLCGIGALYCTVSMHRDGQIVSVYVFMRERKKTRFIVLVSERLLFCPRSGIGVYVVNYQGYPIILNNKWNLTHNNWWPPSLLLLLLCVFFNPGRVNNEASLFRPVEKAFVSFCSDQRKGRTPIYDYDSFMCLLSQLSVSQPWKTKNSTGASPNKPCQGFIRNRSL